MKKFKILLILLLMPFFVFAYSEYIIPGGDTLGIEVNSKGVVVVGFYEVNGSYINKKLSVGDKILRVDKEYVNNTNDLVELIDKYMVNNQVEITFLRKNKEIKTSLDLVVSNGTYKTGLYVKSSILGIGTLTYVDPETKIYGVLGHSLNMSHTNHKIEIKTGYSYHANVTGFIRSTNGNPGSKNADIDKNAIFGSIDNNTDYGIFGKVNTDLKKNKLKVGTLDDARLGKAYIRTTNENNEIKQYEIKIIDINKKDSDKNIYFEITDKELINMSGGIVQGMSGSPIIQDNKIIGAVTRVLVDDVHQGYGISIVTMLEEGDKLVK